MKTLKQIRKDLGLTQAEIGSELGITHTTYNIYENNKKPFPEHLVKLLKEKFNVDYIPVKNEPIKTGVPVYDIDFTAGDIIQFDDFQEKVIGHIDLNGFRKCIAFVKVKGNSMFPTFTAGDLVGLEVMHDIAIIDYGNPFAIVTTTGQSLIKTIRKGKDDDNLILRSNNKEYDDINIHKKQILRLYKAHGPIRDSHY